MAERLAPRKTCFPGCIALHEEHDCTADTAQDATFDPQLPTEVNETEEDGLEGDNRPEPAQEPDLEQATRL